MSGGRSLRLVDGELVLRTPTVDEPWRVLVSGCLAGLPCGVDGTDYGMGTVRRAFLALPAVRALAFCPEDHGLGTPRGMPDLHGGDGLAVLAGRTRVLDEHGTDLTSGMVRGAEAMVQAARAHRAELALLTDLSGACGTQVISDGCRFDTPRRYQRGMGVAAAALVQAGIPVISQRDNRSLGRLRRQADPDFVEDPADQDHHERAWYRSAFLSQGAPAPRPAAAAAPAAAAVPGVAGSGAAWSIEGADPLLALRCLPRRTSLVVERFDADTRDGRGLRQEELPAIRSVGELEDLLRADPPGRGPLFLRELRARVPGHGRVVWQGDRPLWIEAEGSDGEGGGSNAATEALARAVAAWTGVPGAGEGG